MLTAADVRRIALALPETSEQPCYGTPGFYVRAKLFARLREDGTSLMVRCGDVDEKEFLLAAPPTALFTTSHYDGYAAILVRLEVAETALLEEVLTEAWILRAPKRVAERWIADHGD